MIELHSATEPEQCLQRQLALCAVEDGCSAFALSYLLDEYYLPEQACKRLIAVVAAVYQAGVMQALHVCVAPSEDSLVRLLEESEASLEAVEALAAQSALPLFDLLLPLSLSPVAIAKPWGQEIWYTGIEARGQSCFAVGNLRSPLPWLLALAPKRLAAELERQLTLLKVLDPLPEEVYGDLYFEMHQQKQEVYVVTHVDRQAWPAGEGAIRFGFCQSKRANYADDKAFKVAYREAVQAYRQIRSEIDDLLDGKRRDVGVGLNEAISAQQLRLWQAEVVPSSLQLKESQLRAEMDAFTHLQPLQLGDVVKVPCFTPHSLQHGVRTVEFQTPVYERQILAFAQKVLTQSHWDTTVALEQVSLEAPQSTELQLLLQHEQFKVERVVDFDDFEVCRITLQPGGVYDLIARHGVGRGRAYGVLMGVQGEVSFASQHLRPEQALFLPAAAEHAELSNSQGLPAVFLLSVPKACQ